MNGEPIIQKLSVTQLTTIIKEVLEGLPILRSVCVQGEISNLTIQNRTGHIYFTLKDEGAVIKAAMFASSARGLTFRPENGMKINASGRIGVYPPSGAYQLYVDSMEQDGVGSLWIAFEKLKQKLEAEGLFDPAHKKKLPKYPFRIGIITAPTGAAVRDMINVTRRRFPAAQIFLYPSLVQGDGAPAQLISALRCLDARMKCDVIIIGRGGGSIEDLWAFNSEALARQVYACETPIISAVGHETDFTICDFVADLRAPTPSAAAELAVPDLGEQLVKFDNVRKMLQNRLTARIESARQRVRVFSERPVLVSPMNAFDEKKQALSALDDRLGSAAALFTERSAQRLHLQSEKLQGLNPLSVLERGYAAVFDPSGTPITSAAAVASGSEVGVRFRDGSASAVISEVRIKGEDKNG